MIETAPITYVCGCQNQLHKPTGALRSTSKCQRHMRAYRAPETLSEAYFTELGLLKHGMLLPTNHVAELIEALGPIPTPKDNAEALEIGCGVSPYTGLLKAQGWHYTAIEPSGWACGWMRRIYGVETVHGRFEAADDVDLSGPFGLILAAHSIEHMDDAPGAIARCAELLTPGGQLWIVIPDDTDKTNPDHKWFFDQDSLWFTVASTGLDVEAIETRRYVKRENFLYCRARKPQAVEAPKTVGQDDVGASEVTK